MPPGLSDSSQSSPIVEVSSVSKSFKNRSKIREKYRNRNFLFRYFKEILSKKKLKVLDDVSFSLHRGEILGLLGPNGAGKTTMMKACTGLMDPDEGLVEVLGHDMSTESKEIRSDVNAIFARANLFRHLSSYQNLKLFAEIYEVGNYEKKIEEHMKRLEVHDRKNTYVDRLSTGERTKLKLIKAFMTEPKVLFLDEPTSGLDPRMSMKIREYIDELRDNDVSILLTTHYMEEADYLCDRVILINNGELIEKGRPDELKQDLKEETVIEFKLKKFKTSLLEELEDSEEVEDVRYMPDEQKVRVMIESMDRADWIAKKVREMDLGVERIDTVEPTLEDVFIHLTGRELK